MRHLCGIVLLALLTPAIACAQLVRGQVVESGSGQPLYGSIIVLLDSADTQLGGAITDQAGRFTLTAPGPGRYSLSARRIGFRSTRSAAFTLAAGQTLEQTLVASAVPVQLSAIEVTGRERCTTRPEEGQAAFAVWDEVRTALTATKLTMQQRMLQVRVRRFERDLDGLGESVTHEQSWEQTGVSTSPFVAVSLDTLAQSGYARLTDTASWYYAPDANVLLSEAFSEHHCFRVQQSTSGSQLIGLAFEPVRRREVPEVQGVLWLDRTTGELRRMEFHYVKVPRVIERGHFGGDLDFRRLPSGAWIVQRWQLRMPLLGVTVRYWLDGSQYRHELRDSVITGVHETGGEVLAVSAVRGGTAFALTDSAVLRGTVFDSTRGVPLAGALVALAGTADSTRTDSAGAFRLALLGVGTYTVAVTAPRLDSLALGALTLSVTLGRGSVGTVRLSVPTYASMIRAACPDSLRGANTVMVAGTVREWTSGRPVSNAQVTVSWQTWGLGVAQGIAHASGHAVAAMSDRLGHYRACGAAAGVPLTVAVQLGKRRGERVAVPPYSGGEVVLRDVRVRGGTPD